MKKQAALDVVQTWLNALNNRNDEDVIRSSDPDIEIVGPRGSGFGHQLLQDWLNQAHMSLESLCTFARDDRVVVAQHAVWRSVESGDVIGEADVASQFRVKGGRVTQYARYDSLDEALEAARLNDADEIR
jgi:hypothetical protein